MVLPLVLLVALVPEVPVELVSPLVVDELPVPPSVELLELGSELVPLVPSLLGPAPVEAPDEPVPLLPLVPVLLLSVLLAAPLELGLELVLELLVSELLPVPPSVELLELGSELVALEPLLLGPAPVEAPDEPMPLLPLVPVLVSLLVSVLLVELLELGLEVVELLVSDPLPVPPSVELLELGSELVALVPSLLGPAPVEAPDEPGPVVPVLRSMLPDELPVELPYDPLPLCAYAVPASASAPATTNVYRSFIVSPLWWTPAAPCGPAVSVFRVETAVGTASTKERPPESPRCRGVAWAPSAAPLRLAVTWG